MGQRQSLRNIFFKQMGHDIKTRWCKTCHAVEFERAHPKAAVRIPQWKVCLRIFLPFSGCSLSVLYFPAGTSG